MEYTPAWEYAHSISELKFPPMFYVFPEIQCVSIGKVSKFISHDIVACCGKA